MSIFRNDIQMEPSIRPLFEAIGGKYVSVPRRVGFDRIILSFHVISVDWAKVANVLEQEREAGYQTISVHRTDVEEQALSVCTGQGVLPWVSHIRIVLHRNVLIIKRCNIPNRDDICTFEVFIRPKEGFEFLGNISNNSCEEEKQYVAGLMEEVEERYGIKLEKGFSVLREIELNVNIKVKNGANMKSPMAVLAPYQIMLENFESCEFRKSSEDNYLVNEQSMWKEKVPGMKSTGVSSKAPTRKVKVYDKKADVIRKVKEDREDKREIQVLSDLCRIEFTLTKKEMVETYCHGKANLFELTQEDIEDAFHLLSTRLIKNPLDLYYKQFDYALEEYFAHIDINTYGWREKLVSKVMESVLGTQIGFYNITEKDIRRNVSLMDAPTVKTHGSYVAKSVIKKFRELGGKRILVTKEEKAYKEWVDWLCNVKGEEPQEVYVVYDYPEE